jgi:integrase
MERRKVNGYVCTSAAGGMLTDSSFQSGWTAFRNYLNVCAGGQNANGLYIKRVQVIDNITAHMLRHTYATMLFDANVDVKSAQKFLGHSDLEVTLEIYTHLTKYKEETAINALNAHLDAKVNSLGRKESPSLENPDAQSVEPSSIAS